MVSLQRTNESVSEVSSVTIPSLLNHIFSVSNVVCSVSLVGPNTECTQLSLIQ